jgi:Spy/CpxP family protein refolding chaperone
MTKRHIWLFVPLVFAAVLLTVTAGASARVLTGAGAADPQSPSVQPPPGPPPGGFGPGGPGGRGGPRGIDGMIFRLDLTGEQKEQLKAIREEAMTAAKPYEEQARAADDKIRAMVEAGTFDEDAVRTLATGQAKASIELRVIQARVEVNSLKVLTAEQRAELQKMHDERPGRPGRPGRGGRGIE